MSCTLRLTIVSLLMLSLLGCENKRVIRPANIDKTQTGANTDAGSSKQFVDQAVNYLDGLDRYEPVRVKSEVLEQLNRWLNVQKFDKTWQPDPMIADLPSEVQGLPRLQNLETRDFLEQPNGYPNFTMRGSEFDFFVGTYWAKTISNWIRETKLPPESMQKFLDAQENKTLDESQVADLGLAYLLFDWTVRHIQPIKPTKYEEGKFAPGTSRDVWEALQLNEGDALERARVFIQLCRQQGLDAVVVKFGKDKDAVTQVVGVAIGKELYLFDTAYGLPISTADGSGINTLSRIVEHPADLQAMATKNYKYPVSADDLKNVTLLIDAPSTSLTQAAYLLEGVLSGDSTMKLYVSPSSLKDRLADFQGVTDVQLWMVPFLAEEAMSKRLSDPDLAQLFSVERWLYDTPTPFSMARMLQLMCRFEGESQQPGARRLFLEARILERKFRISTPSEQLEILKASGMDLPSDPKSQQVYLDRIHKSMVMWRELASFNLGVISLGAGQNESAVFFFQDGTLKEFPNTRLKSAAYYGIGRACEALAIEEDDPAMAQNAYDIYTDDDDVLSPYRRGNTLRAERLPLIEETEEPAKEDDKADAKPMAEPEGDKPEAEEKKAEAESSDDTTPAPMKEKDSAEKDSAES
ncbi:hypothetical protein AB1L30_15045 [Bremerella sp. JC817]|uniref:hypothetical protein n=1 Tax=Bremerella sp. JC817 TaxID=3231756 RepID=UPI003458C0A8